MELARLGTNIEKDKTFLVSVLYDISRALSSCRFDLAINQSDMMSSLSFEEAKDFVGTTIGSLLKCLKDCSVIDLTLHLLASIRWTKSLLKEC